jgi:REP-associated tyrosine transposase
MTTKTPECGRGLLAATKLNLKSHSKDLRLNREKTLPATFFITKSLQPKKALLDSSVRKTIVSALEFGVQQNRIYLRAFVVMPDHWHALLGLRAPWTLPRFMHAMMTFVGTETTKVLGAKGATWQDGYHDTRIKTWKQFRYVTRYIEQNPVTKGLVSLPAEWPASSACLINLVTEPWPYTYD